MYTIPSFRIEGGRKLEGDIFVQGGKNAALPLIAATLLTKEECCLQNVPDIEDVRKMLDIVEKMGASVERQGNTVFIQSKDIDPSNLPVQEAQQIRASIVLLGPLLSRFSEVTLPYPGGDKIGKRPIDTHLDAFEDIGCEVKRDTDHFSIRCVQECDMPSEIVLNDFSVTATENIIMFAAYHRKTIDLITAAEEPSVQNLCEMLRGMGAHIQVLPYHRLRITGSNALHATTVRTKPDYIEAGTFVAMVLAVGGDVRIKNFPTQDLKLLLHLLKRRKARIQEEGDDCVRVQTTDSLYLGKIQTMIYPGFPTDLQSPFGTLATQLEGKTVIHDPLFEGRLEYLQQLEQMGAKVHIIDDHRAEIEGPTQLYGTTLEGKDIRGAMSFIIAGMAAEGVTVLKNAYQVDRGYENIEKRLQSLGARVERLS